MDSNGNYSCSDSRIGSTNSRYRSPLLYSSYKKPHTHTNASSHLAEPAALFSRKSDLPDTIVARTSGFVRGRWPKDSGYSPVEIPGAHTVHSVRRSFSSAPSIRSVVFFSRPTFEPSTIRRVSPVSH